jgi:DNA-binding NarL/FixJ family response regulator
MSPAPSPSPSAPSSDATRRLRVVLADDHTMVREAIAQALAGTGRVDVVGQAATGDEAVAIVTAASPPPDVLLLDYTMPGLLAPQVIERLRGVDVRVLVLTLHENPLYATKALEAGAAGYVLKTASIPELLAGVEAVARGERYLTAALELTVAKSLAQPRRERSGLAALSTREFELLCAICAGRSLKECADELDVSVSAAYTYRTRLMDKLGVRSTADMVRVALESKLVP